MKNIQETLEEAAEREYPTIHEQYQYDAFIEGAKWQEEKIFGIMQEYAEFCVKCDREKLPLLLAKDWFEQFKKK